MVLSKIIGLYILFLTSKEKFYSVGMLNLLITLIFTLMILPIEQKVEAPTCLHLLELYWQLWQFTASTQNGSEGGWGTEDKDSQIKPLHHLSTHNSRQCVIDQLKNVYYNCLMIYTLLSHNFDFIELSTDYLFNYFMKIFKNQILIT